MEEYYVLLASLILSSPGLIPGQLPRGGRPVPGPAGSIVAIGDDAARVATSVTFAATKAPTLRKPA